MSELYNISVKDIDMNSVDLRTYEGKTLLIVNVASKCGFTPQYKDLQNLYEKYQEQGLEVLGFPCNQFGGQEPGTHQEIQTFCESTYGVTFPMMAKVDVNGDNRHPLFAELCKVKDANGIEDIKWNFNKFIVREDGSVERFSHRDEPADLPF